MDRERNQWLHQEIARWQEEGILDDKTGELLRSRYPLSAKSGISRGILAFSVLGGLMAGLGVISLFAANWEFLSRGVRALVSILPLAVCGMAGVLGMRRGWRRAAFWEGLGVAWMISLVAGLCLVLQTYQVGGNVSRLVLLLALLSLPIVWTTRSVVAMVFWLGYPLVWHGAIQSEQVWEGARPPFPWISVASLALLALSLPAFLDFLRRKKELFQERVGFFFPGGAYPGLLLLFFSGFFPYLPASRLFSGILFSWLCAAGLYWVAHRGKFPCWCGWARFFAIAPALLVPVIPAGVCFHRGEVWLLMAASLALAAWLVYRGVRTLRLRVFDEGLFLGFWLILVKFFTTEISLTLKGVLFLLSGLGMLAGNVCFVTYRKRRSLHEENA
ncbi:MAG: DUF2157 domain-containing protein [Oligosphaeraceae bacterium]